MPDDVSLAKLTQISHDLDIFYTYLQKKSPGNNRQEKAELQAILDSLDEVQDQIKVIKRYISERMYDGIFGNARVIVAPKLVAISNALKNLGSFAAINIMLSELFEKIS